MIRGWKEGEKKHGGEDRGKMRGRFSRKKRWRSTAATSNLSSAAGGRKE